MKRTFAAASLVAAFAMPLAAQDTRSLAEDYATLPAVQAMVDDMFSAEAMAAQFRAGLPPTVPITEAQIAEVGALLATQMEALRPRLSEVMVETSADLFTAEELEALIAFYSTDVGASVLGKSQNMMTDVMGQLGPDMLALQQTIMPEIATILQDR